MSQTEQGRGAKRRQADVIVEFAARQLQDILISLASEADSLFPYFPNSNLRLIEVEPGNLAKTNIGFVALCPDGLLYELSVGLDLDPFEMGHRASLKDLDLTPQDYVAYAYNAVCQLTALLDKAATGE